MEKVSNEFSAMLKEVHHIGYLVEKLSKAIEKLNAAGNGEFISMDDVVTAYLIEEMREKECFRSEYLILY